MTLYHGRPADETGRLEKEIRTYDFLDSLGVDYVRIDHDPAMKMEACSEIDAFLGTKICKNLFLCTRTKSEYYLLMMPADKRFSTSAVSAQVASSRLSFGTPEDMERLLDLTPGSVSVLGLINDKERRVKLLVDADVLESSYIGCHPCINTTSLRIRTEDFKEKIFPALGHMPRIVKL